MCASDRHKWPCHAHPALAAIDAVLEIHKAADRGRVLPCCEGCETGDTASPAGCHEYPCPTVEAIASALTREADHG